jgi:hypothetical protein
MPRTAFAPVGSGDEYCMVINPAPRAACSWLTVKGRQLEEELCTHAMLRMAFLDH